MNQEQVKVVSINTAAYLIGTGIEAVRKAIRSDKISNVYTLHFGETTVPLLRLADVLEYWSPAQTNWFKRKLEDISRGTFIVKAQEDELEVLAGEMTRIRIVDGPNQEHTDG